MIEDKIPLPPVSFLEPTPMENTISYIGYMSNNSEYLEFVVDDKTISITIELKEQK